MSRLFLVEDDLSLVDGLTYSLKKNGFEHRQGSGYVSKNSLDDLRITAIITNMTLTLKWLRFCVKEIDVTNIGKQHSLLDTINKPYIGDDLSNLDDIEI